MTDSLVAVPHILCPTAHNKSTCCAVYTFVHRYVFEMIPDYARNVISGFARLGGETVGIIANNPLVLAGELTPVYGP